MSFSRRLHVYKYTPSLLSSKGWSYRHVPGTPRLDSCGRVKENILNLEVKRRTDTNRAIQVAFETHIHTVGDKLEAYAVHAKPSRT